MATLEELRSKLKKINDRRGGGSRTKWFPKDVHSVRLLPIPGQEEPYKVLYFHYLNKKPIYCPLMNGTDSSCDLCKLSESLKEWDDDKTEAARKADFKQGCSLEAGPKYYHPMVERMLDKDTKKVTNSTPMWWSMSESVWKDVMNICLKEDVVEMHRENIGEFENAWDSLTCTKYAFDIDVNLQKANNEDGKGNNKQYNNTKVSEKKRETALSNDQAEVDKVLASIPPFDGIETPLTSADVEKLLEQYLNSDAPAAKADSDGLEKKTAGADSRNDELPASGKRSVEDALNDLLK